jgi:hypothetical protein
VSLSENINNAIAKLGAKQLATQGSRVHDKVGSRCFWNSCAADAVSSWEE